MSQRCARRHRLIARLSSWATHLRSEARLRGDRVGRGKEGELPEVVAAHRRQLVEPLGRDADVRLRPDVGR